MKTLTARLLMVGNELLSGRTVDTNAATIARTLFDAGVTVAGKETLPDEQEAIAQAVKRAKEDIVLLSGGLGPTSDDLTRNGLAAAFGVGLKRDARQIKRMEAFFKKVKRPMAVCNTVQAEVPGGFEALDNPFGTAPALFKRKPFIIALPGVPREVQGLLTTTVLPLIRRHFRCPPIHIEEIRTSGIGESLLFERIAEVTQAPGVGFSSLPETYGVLLRFYGQDKKKVTRVASAVRKRCTDFIYTNQEETLQETVHRHCSKTRQTLAVAESCTGGLLSSKLVSVPGSSAWFLGGTVTYANALKEQWIQVPRKTLKKHGAVSAETAIAMANGIRKAASSDLALSITGIAGPDGGTAEKPTGTVYIALASQEKTTSHLFHFFGGRDAVRERAACAALFLLIKELRSRF